MRLNNKLKTMIFGNIELIRFCNNSFINIEKLKQCEIERMNGIYMFALEKENKPVSKCMIPLDVDIATQPDVVLIMEVNDDGTINFKTTDKTKRILNI